MRMGRWILTPRVRPPALLPVRQDTLGRGVAISLSPVRMPIGKVPNARLLGYALWTFDFHSKQDLKELLNWTRRMALDRLGMLAGRGDDRLTNAEWDGPDHPEPWTARKAARKLVYHERWHLDSIRRLQQGFRSRDSWEREP
jgi:hypothetical protein